MGIKGVVLGYAKEVVLKESEVDALKTCGEYKEAETCIKARDNPMGAGQS